MNNCNNKGFSLIEVMTSLALGLVVILMVVQIFINAKNNHAQNDRVSETLETGRYALRQISTDLKEAGFFGGVLDTSLIKPDTSLGTITTDCGASGETNWAFDVNTYRSIQYDDASVYPSTYYPPTDHTCINAGDYQKNTDALVVKRVFNTPYSSTGTPPNPNMVYLRSDYNTACLWFYGGTSTSPSGGNCPAAGASTYDWRYITDVYYIQNHDSNGNSIPTLCRISLEGTTAGPTMKKVCLAPGVEAFHVMFGIDTDATYDGIANKYVSNPTATELRNRVVSARIYVLVRALQQDSKLTSNKQFTMGDLKLGPFTSDNYYRRMYSTTVILRNPMYAGAFN